MPIGRSARRGMIAGAAISSSRAKKRAAIQQPTQAAPSSTAPAATSADSDDMFAQLEKLGELKDKGILTQAEFDAKKKQILGL